MMDLSIENNNVPLDKINKTIYMFNYYNQYKYIKIVNMQNIRLMVNRSAKIYYHLLLNLMGVYFVSVWLVLNTL